MSESAVSTERVLDRSPGVWESALRFGDLDAAVAAIAELERFGYSSVWLPDVGGDLFGTLDALLSATTTIVVASGVLNIWMHDPMESARRYGELEARFPGRVLVGAGASHAPVVDMLTGTNRFSKPLAALERFLDDAHGVEENGEQLLPRERTLLGALGPKALDLARTRSGGALTYLVTSQYNAIARERLGPDRLLYAHQAVVLTEDDEVAMSIARKTLEVNFTLPNYVNSWRRCGFSDVDVTAPGSNSLMNALVAWGDTATISSRLSDHLRAGADNVCVQIMTDRPDQTVLPLDEYRELAQRLKIGPFASASGPTP